MQVDVVFHYFQQNEYYLIVKRNSDNHVSSLLIFPYKNMFCTLLVLMQKLLFCSNVPSTIPLLLDSPYILFCNITNWWNSWISVTYKLYLPSFLQKKGLPIKYLSKEFQDLYSFVCMQNSWYASIWKGSLWCRHQHWVELI